MIWKKPLLLCAALFALGGVGREFYIQSNLRQLERLRDKKIEELEQKVFDEVYSTHDAFFAMNINDVFRDLQRNRSSFLLPTDSGDSVMNRLDKNYLRLLGAYLKSDEDIRALEMKAHDYNNQLLFRFLLGYKEHPLMK